jgi:hypothetical protein
VEDIQVSLKAGERNCQIRKNLTNVIDDFYDAYGCLKDDLYATPYESGYLGVRLDHGSYGLIEWCQHF